jgi:hypothetical protein
MNYHIASYYQPFLIEGKVCFNFLTCWTVLQWVITTLIFNIHIYKSLCPQKKIHNRKKKETDGHVQGTGTPT